MQEISANDAAKLVEQDSNVQFLDVREGWEYALVHVEGTIHIPLNELPNRLGELDKSQPVLAICHHGMRSAHACQFLAAQGFSELINLHGGIDAWSSTVDTNLARY